MSKITAYSADYLPLLGQLMNQMRLPQLINEIVAKPNTQARLDAGTMVAGMILNLLSDSKIRLYRMHHYFEDKPLPLMFTWNPDVKAEDFTEDRAGNVLDELFQAGPQKVFSSVSRQIMQIYKIDSSRLRVDTTSKSFYGVYDIDEPPVEITYGFSKNKRPDLKQIMFGVGTSADGIPLIGEVMSGNTSDMNFNNGWIKTVRKELHQSDDDFLLYTADSAAITEDNLKLFDEFRVDLISRLPERYDLAYELIDQAINEANWSELGTFGEGKNAAVYKSTSIERVLFGKTYRFVVVHSSTHDKRKLKALNNRREKEKEELEKIIEETSKREFFCEKDALVEMEKFQKEYNPNLTETQIF